jgi:hypothetical protein
VACVHYPEEEAADGGASAGGPAAGSGS